MTPTFPHEVRPVEAGQDLGSYIASERATLNELLARHAAILLRKSDMPVPESLVIACRQLSPNFVDYFGGGDLSKRISGRINNSTELLANQKIPLHCKTTCSPVPPERFLFYSQTVAVTGGEMPISDMAHVLATTPTDLVVAYEKCGALYFSNMHVWDGFGCRWCVFLRRLLGRGLGLDAVTWASAPCVHGPRGKTVWGNRAAAWNARWNRNVGSCLVQIRGNLRYSETIRFHRILSLIVCFPLLIPALQPDDCEYIAVSRSVPKNWYCATIPE